MKLKKPQWVYALLWPNLAVGVVMLVLAASGQITSLRQLGHDVAYALVYANVVSLLAVLTVTAIARRFSLPDIPIAWLLAFCMLVAIPAGCLVVQLLLVAVGVQSAHHFWRDYLAMLRVGMPLAAVFGLGAFLHSSLRDRLERTEQKLHEKELAEERARKLAAQARLQFLEARIQPHFLFNTLNSISALIALDPARAEQMVGRLAVLLRTSLDHSERPLIALSEELRIVGSYLDIEQARFGDKLRASFEVPPDLQSAQVPPMSVQGLVENAVKHGITTRPQGGDIRVVASMRDGTVQIRVCDSGPGFDLGVVPPGHGLDNLVERLNALFSDKASLNAYRRDGQCVVEMSLPRV